MAENALVCLIMFLVCLLILSLTSLPSLLELTVLTLMVGTQLLYPQLFVLIPCEFLVDSGFYNALTHC